MKPAPAGSTHVQILKSSSIVGGSQAIGLIIGMIRTKLLAVILGTAGPAAVGLLGVYTTINQMVASVANLGIGSSGVREISLACASGNELATANLLIAVRRLLFVLGIAGSTIMFALAPVFSTWSFGSTDHATDIRILSVTIVLANIAGGQTSILQGRRLLRDMGMLGIWSAMGGTLVAIPMFYLLGIKAVVPSMVVAAIISCVLGWFYSRKHALEPVEQTVGETLDISRRLIKLGIAFLGAGFLAMAATWMVQAMIARNHGQTALGQYAAAFRLSGFLVSFVLGAMSADFFPRLSAVAMDNRQMVRLINEQIEIGVLLCAPPLVAMLCFADWVIPLFYSNQFADAVPMFRWLVLGCLGRVFSWPLASVFMAKGASTGFLLTEILFALVHVGGVWLGTMWFGPIGAAAAFCGMYVLYYAAMHVAMHRWIGFRMTKALLGITLAVGATVGASTVSFLGLEFLARQFAGVVIVVFTGVWALRTLGRIIGTDSGLAAKLARLPLVRRLLGWQG